MKSSGSFFRVATLILILALATAAVFLLTPERVYSAGQEQISTAPPGQGAGEDYESGESSQILLTIEIVVGLLLIASLVAIVTERLRVPYTAGLVVIGLFLALIGEQEVNVSPDLFLGILVPPLIFEAAFQVKARDLMKDLAPILSLSVLGVLLTTFLVSGVLYYGTNFPLATSLLFGSLIAATDPVAVVALFRTLGVPHRLLLLLEGESLLNDGTAIVLFNLMLAFAVTGEFNLGQSLINFIFVSGGGLLTGFVLGFLISQAISTIENALIETTLTTVLAFGSYILAEQFGVSGVLAVVAAGLVSGNLGPQRMAPTTRILVFNFWDYAAFLANSFVFLLIGLQIDLNILLTDWQAILWAILAVLVSRAASIYGLSWIGPGIPMRFKHVLYWGGLRGAISLALALSLPVSLGVQGDQLQVMAFGVVLFTLLVQGLTMKPLIRRMDLIQKSQPQKEYESLHAQAVMSRTAYKRLEGMHQDGLLSRPVWKLLSGPLDSHANSLMDAASHTMSLHPEVELNELNAAINAALNSERAALQRLLRENKVTDETFSKLAQEIDAALTNNQASLVRYIKSQALGDIKELITIIVQEADLSNITELLEPSGFPITPIASTGGFLGRKNVTLLIGIPAGKKKEIRALLDQVRSTISSAQPTSSDMSYDHPIGITTLFSVPVERYEEL
jgi:CPA1 family monovalent cation:H+ antiporter